MGNRICRTCGHGTCSVVTCDEQEHQHSGLHSPDEKACRNYIERTDSLEQVALDMLNNLCGIAVTVSIDAKALDAGVMAEGRRRYADRLCALGVEVPQ